MSNSLSKDLGLIDGKIYIISRASDTHIEGCIYINSPSVSRPHLKMQIKNGRIHLRDLNSTNGTYLIENNRLVPFEEGYVSSHQPLVIGEIKCTILSLLEIASVYSAPENNTPDFNETQKIEIPIPKPVKKIETD